jgi:predicted membrane-bound mannosyltransferase
LAIYTIVVTVVYSAISYKTPWCMLGFLEGMILLAGIGVVVLFARCRSWGAKTAIAIVLLAATSHLGWEAWRANYGLTPDENLFAADNRNPYTYSQTLPGILELVQHVQGVAKIHPDGTNMLITVMAKDHDYWPLPFYLRGFKRVGFWDDVQKENHNAPVVITSPHFDAALKKNSNTNLFSAGLYELRPNVFLELYVQFDLWEKHIENRPRPKED